MALTCIKNLLRNLQHKYIFLVLTHCDQKMPDKAFITNKIRSLKKYTDVDIPEENVVLFEKSKESLVEFTNKFVKSDATFNGVEECLE